MPKAEGSRGHQVLSQLGYSAAELRLLTAQQLVDAGLGSVRPFATAPLRHGSASDYSEVPPDLLWSLLGLTSTQLKTVHEWLASTHPGALSTPPKRPSQRHNGGKAWLEDAFVHFHRFMFDAALLPLSKWGIGRDLWRKASGRPSITPSTPSLPSIPPIPTATNSIPQTHPTACHDSIPSQRAGSRHTLEAGHGHLPEAAGSPAAGEQRWHVPRVRLLGSGPPQRSRIPTVARAGSQTALDPAGS